MDTAGLSRVLSQTGSIYLINKGGAAVRYQDS